MMIDYNNELIVVDVREQNEYCNQEPPAPAVGHIPGALNYPWNSGVFEQNYAELPNDGEILIVCRVGGRSAAAAGFLCAQEQFQSTPIYNMTGGMLAWASMGWETVGCCFSQEECDDGLYCNGVETCVNLNCQPGTYPCTPHYCCDEVGNICLAHIGDYDCDGVPDDGGDHLCTTGEIENCDDNCSEIANGPFQGVCTKQVNENLFMIRSRNCASDGDCEAEEFCNMNQLDGDSDGCGDPCECEADFEYSGGVDGVDLQVFLADWLRNPLNNPCTPPNPPCEGDFDGSGAVDGLDLQKFTEDWLRGPLDRPCPGY